MFALYDLDDETCPNCGGQAIYGTKEDVSSWKVFVMCENTEDFDEDCTWERMAGRVQMSDVDSHDDVDEQAKEKAKKFT